MLYELWFTKLSKIMIAAQSCKIYKDLRTVCCCAAENRRVKRSFCISNQKNVGAKTPRKPWKERGSHWKYKNNNNNKTKLIKSRNRKNVHLWFKNIRRIKISEQEPLVCVVTTRSDEAWAKQHRAHYGPRT